ncbi:hypothetical protein NVP1187O_098 [Vibrio phage 1.187.O._10N.286.49.F1]|nr:hypothetical protein NVP1187O_098 [Vibrio phage 1.187.O._10N.286.49.F1]
MIDKLKLNWYLLCAKWKYRKQDHNEVCCCGTGMEKRYHTILGYYYNCPDYWCVGRCAKEYAITCYVESKLKG